jgi:endonuclease/exonuclease/phosphatase family metal-dependent hydrolase
MKIATFNMENLDDKADDRNPSLEVRGPFLRAMLNRMEADIICLQEIHGQELPDHTSDNPKRELSALDSIIAGTDYDGYEKLTTLTSDNVPYDVRNLVILSKYPIINTGQYRNEHIKKLQYRKVTAIPEEEVAKDIRWERPILYAEIEHPELGKLHVINLHLKSRLASRVKGQKDGYRWKTAAGWAEGYFLSSMKRVGQALETRVLLDSILDAESDAKILVCGDFNAEPGEVPVEAICGRVENTDNLELRSRVLISCSRGIPESVRFSHLHHGKGNLLDHVLISQSLLPYYEQAEIFNENLHDESLPFAFDPKYPESDHAPFVASFRVENG